MKPWEPDEFECDVKGVQKGGAQKGRGRRVAQMKTGADESEGGSIQGRGERGVSSAASDSEERWWIDWRKRIDCWWISLPPSRSAPLQACIGSLGLHLARRFEHALRTLQGRAQQTPPLQRPPQQSPPLDPGCAWLNRETSLVDLPPFPDFPAQFDGSQWRLVTPDLVPPMLPRPPPIPRLLPRWRHLHSQRALQRRADAQKLRKQPPPKPADALIDTPTSPERRSGTDFDAVGLALAGAAGGGAVFFALALTLSAANARRMYGRAVIRQASRTVPAQLSAAAAA